MLLDIPKDDHFRIVLDRRCQIFRDIYKCLDKERYTESARLSALLMALNRILQTDWHEAQYSVDDARNIKDGLKDCNEYSDIHILYLLFDALTQALDAKSLCDIAICAEYWSLLVEEPSLALQYCWSSYVKSLHSLAQRIYIEDNSTMKLSALGQSVACASYLKETLANHGSNRAVGMQELRLVASHWFDVLILETRLRGKELGC